MKFAAIIAISTLLAACSTASSGSSGSTGASASGPRSGETQTVDATSAGDPEEVICERKNVTGSRFPQKVCMTRAMWEDQRQQGKEAVDGVNRSALGSCVPGAGGGCGG